MHSFFSIVIPTYNRVSLIGATIDSVINQTFENFEVLVIDDGSTDNTGNYIKSKYFYDDRIKYFYKDNQERGAARNYGFKKSIGNFVLFLDSDDLLKNIHLENLYEIIIKNPSIDFIASKFQLNRNGFFVDSELSVLEEGFYDINIVLKGNPFACNFAVRRNNPNLILFREDKNFIIVEDWVFLVENLRNNKIYLINSNSVIMNDHEHRSMHGSQDLIIKARLFALNWLLKNYSFNHSHARIITGNSYYFCSIHNYIDGRKIQGLQFLIKSVKYLGWDLRTMKLLIKLLIGRNLILTLSR
jgi:glycosyltransferase involved in cell wall biosynthesis